MSDWDDETGYDRSDPKHPDWAEGQRERADLARKADRERDAFRPRRPRPDFVTHRRVATKRARR